MYPTEYMWSRVPTPVMNRHMVSDSGATSRPMSTLNEPEAIQVKMV